MAAGTEPDELSTLGAVRTKFDLSVNLQRIIADAFTDVRGSVERNMNKISHITRLKLRKEVSGKHVSPLAVQFEVLDGLYFLYAVFIKGAHLMIIFKDNETNSIVVFDPNFGILGAEGKDEVKGLSTALFAAYARAGQTLGEWEVLSVSPAESALDRFKRVSGAR